MNFSALKKAFRFLCIYGPGRTIFKVLGRSRFPISISWRKCFSPDIALIGCGQFGFATIGYFITRHFGRRFLYCFDTEQKAASTFQKAFRVPNLAQNQEQFLSDPAVKVVYIASNHHSHSDYACAALAAGKDVYIEKPVSVTLTQLEHLCASADLFDKKVFAGYNRPFSGAVRMLRTRFGGRPTGALSLQCFVSGHVLGPDHWYRKPEEGTRICGNAGHWIDLFIHMLAWRGHPDHFRITLLSGNPPEPDDNFSLSIATDHGDIFSLMLTARSEPFEGINETLCFQQDDVICKIDDFRKMTIWQGDKVSKKRFWPKDVGHKMAILQPFQSDMIRDWDEVVRSTLLMLHITDMVREGTSTSTFSMTCEKNKLHKNVKNWIEKYYENN